MVELKEMLQPNLGENCKRIRENRNMTIADFAQFARCTRQAVYYFETGKSQSMQMFLKYLELNERG